MPRFIVSLLTLTASLGLAATSKNGAPSPMGGNGHNVSFDGRLFIVRTSPGWMATVLRPQAVVLTPGQAPSLSNAFSTQVLIQAAANEENALAICEETSQPTRCDASGAANGNGTHRCYDVMIIDSNAVTPPPNNVLRRRRLKVIVSDPDTAQAAIASFSWTDSTLTPLQTTLRGIEPTVTRDGRLLVWQGHPNNTGAIDTLVYSYNATACGVSGWSAPKPITAMNTDPNIVGRYRLAERPLRDPGGVVYGSTQVFYGAYPWIFPDGEAINFTATNMPCRTPAPNEDPPGCGPRRNALSVIGYPTNWQIAHIDGSVNPSTEDNVRLFFSSPGPLNARPLPIATGLDVWPFFGSNTSNYGEIVFDDALGQYAAFWHLNEFVTAQGTFDRARTADSSGNSNTGAVRPGATFPAVNNGAVGKALSFDGVSGRVEVPHAASLLPVNAITVELSLKPRSSPDCDANNNYRLVFGKPNINGAYSLVLEDDRSFQARVRVAGGVQYDIRSNGVTAPIGQWTHVAFEYDAATGTMAFLVNGTEVNRVVRAPAALAGTNDVLYIGAPGARAACPPTGDGAFDGELDEVAISRSWRYGTPPGGMGGGSAGGGSAAGGSSGTGGGTTAGGSSGTGGGSTAGGVSGTGGGSSGTGGGATAGGAPGGGVSGTGGGSSGTGGGSSMTGGGTSGTGGGAGTGGGTGGTGGGVSGTGGGAAGTGGGVSGTGGGVTPNGGGASSAGGGAAGGRSGVTASGTCASVGAEPVLLLLLAVLRARRRRA